MPQVILADKSDLFRRSITSVLQREGYEVTAADSGYKVLNLAQANPPSVIILDTETPDPSGLETLLLLKKDPKLRRLPVIVVSRDSAPSAVSNAFKVGADSFMLKPIDLNVLLKALAGMQVPVPALGGPVRATFGHHVFNGTLRFLDQYGMVYLDHLPPTELEAAGKAIWDPRTPEERTASLPGIGEMGIIDFESDGKAYHQRVLLSEQNEGGLVAYPVGNPGTSETPDMLRVPSSYKARYLVPGSFMKLADVAMVYGNGLHLHGLLEQPKFNSSVKVTLYPQSASGTEGGIPLVGKIMSCKPTGDSGYEVDVQLTEPPGVLFVNMMAELIGGRPAPRTLAPVEVPS